MRLVFHHTPKTGGSTVLQALHEAMKVVPGMAYSGRVNWGNDVDGRAFIDDKQPLIASSHHAFHPNVFKPETGEFYFTWVRDPVDMVYSAYHYFRNVHGGVDGVMPLFLFNRILAYDTIEEYIDACLYHVSPFFPETVYTGMDFSKFDYIGSAARMAPDLNALLFWVSLSDEFDESRPVPTLNVHTSPGMRTYRRADLSARLEPEMEAIRPWL